MPEALERHEVATFVARELVLIDDVAVREALTSRLIRPERHLRQWEYGTNDEQFPCWTVLADLESDTAIVFSRHGHGPHHPWGLVSLSELRFGMDSGWFYCLEDAFVESRMGAALPIWNVVSPDGILVAASLSLTAAYELRDRTDAARRVVYRSLHPDGLR